LTAFFNCWSAGRFVVDIDVGREREAPLGVRGTRDDTTNQKGRSNDFLQHAPPNETCHEANDDYAVGCLPKRPCFAKAVR
jgi:hypothetical protein